MDLKYSAQTFAGATTISCVTREQPLGCSLCSMLEPYMDKVVSCSFVITHSCIQAARFGGKYISFCPLGLVHLATQYIAAGPILLISHEEFFQEEIVCKYQLPSNVQQQVKEYVYSLDLIEPQRVSYLSELLYMITSNCSADPTLVQNRNNLMRQSTLSEYIHQVKNAEDKEQYPYNKERQLLMTISSGNKHEAQKLLNEILAYIFVACGGNLEVTKSRVLELVVLFSRSAISGGADGGSIFSEKFDYLNKINNFDNVEELIYWLWEILNTCLDSVFNIEDVKHKDIIHKALMYINSNCTEKITLEDVSEMVHLSPTYFSKIFKDELGQSFINYLNATRVEKAKAILLHEDVPLVEVAGLVGFEDQSYFSKVFKKIAGDTPGSYRRQNINKTAF